MFHQHPSKKRFGVLLGVFGVVAALAIGLTLNHAALTGQLVESPLCPAGLVLADQPLSGTELNVQFIPDSMTPAKSVEPTYSHCPPNEFGVGVFYKTHPAKLDSVDGVGLLCMSAEQIGQKATWNTAHVIAPSDVTDISEALTSSVVVPCNPGDVMTRSIFARDVQRADQPDALDGVGITCAPLRFGGIEGVKTYDRIPSDIQATGNPPMQKIDCGVGGLAITGIGYDDIGAKNPDATDAIQKVTCAQISNLCVTKETKADAGLTVNISPAIDRVTPGQTVTYSVQATNYGPDRIEQLRVELPYVFNVYPDNILGENRSMGLVDAPQCDPAKGSTIRCGASLAAGETVTFPVTFRIPENIASISCGETISLRGTATTFPEQDVNVSNNEVTAPAVRVVCPQTSEMEDFPVVE